MFALTVCTNCLSASEQVWATLPPCATAFVASDETPRTNAEQTSVATMRRPARTGSNHRRASGPVSTLVRGLPVGRGGPRIEEIDRVFERFRVEPVRVRVLDRVIHAGRGRLAGVRAEDVRDRQRME